MVAVSAVSVRSASSTMYFTNIFEHLSTRFCMVLLVAYVLIAFDTPETPALCYL
jgi:hypothetical protein